MRRCRLGHENDDTATRCVVCLGRLVSVGVVAFVDLPPGPVPVGPGAARSVRLVLRQDEGEATTYAVRLSGEAHTWVAEPLATIGLLPGENHEVVLRVEVPEGSGPGFQELTVEIWAVGEDGPSASAVVTVEVLAGAPGPTAADETVVIPSPTIDEPPPRPAPAQASTPTPPAAAETVVIPSPTIDEPPPRPAPAQASIPTPPAAETVVIPAPPMAAPDTSPSVTGSSPPAIPDATPGPAPGPTPVPSRVPARRPSAGEPRPDAGQLPATYGAPPAAEPNTTRHRPARRLAWLVWLVAIAAVAVVAVALFNFLGGTDRPNLSTEITSDPTASEAGQLSPEAASDLSTSAAFAELEKTRTADAARLADLVDQGGWLVQLSGKCANHEIADLRDRDGRLGIPDGTPEVFEGLLGENRILAFHLALEREWGGTVLLTTGQDLGGGACPSGLTLWLSLDAPVAGPLPDSDAALCVCSLRNLPFGECGARPTDGGRPVFWQRQNVPDSC